MEMLIVAGTGNHYLEVQEISELYGRGGRVRAGAHGIAVPDRELACAPIDSPLGARYPGAIRAAINCALANRQIFTALAREVVAELLPQPRLDLLCEVSHNIC